MFRPLLRQLSHRLHTSTCTAFTCLTILTGAPGCGTVLLSTPVTQTAKGWKIRVLKVSDGPNEYSNGGPRSYPEADHDFIWVIMEVTNTGTREREFNYSRCNLDDGTDTYQPSIVDMNAFLNLRVHWDTESLDPGESIDRKIAFVYPEDRLPTRLACGEVVIPLNLKSD